MTTGAVGKLPMSDSMIHLDQPHCQRTGAHVDATISRGLSSRNELVHRPPSGLGWSRLPPLSARTDVLLAPTLNMQAQKAFDSPRRAIRGAVADSSQDRLNSRWPKGRTA